MTVIKPKFYDDFRCTASKCTDNCCIGWEIDIDENTLEKYKGVSGDFSDYIKSNITKSPDGSNCFVLKENGRCAFLDGENLCMIYKNCGSNFLCDICREHPRFYNSLYSCEEAGLGLCCEEVSRLLFESSEFELVREENGEIYEEASEDEIETESELLDFRKILFSVICNENETLEKCIEKVILNTEAFSKKYDCEVQKVKVLSDTELVDIMKKTEAVDDNWQPLLNDIENSILIINDNKKAFFESFPECEKDYRKFLCYSLFRHFSQSLFDGRICERVSFSINSMRFIVLCDVLTFLKTGTFTKRDRINNVKYYSKQIEYSEENTEMLIVDNRQL